MCRRLRVPARDADVSELQPDEETETLAEGREFTKLCPHGGSLRVRQMWSGWMSCEGSACVQARERRVAQAGMLKIESMRWDGYQRATGSGSRCLSPTYLRGNAKGRGVSS